MPKKTDDKPKKAATKKPPTQKPIAAASKPKAAPKAAPKTAPKAVAAAPATKPAKKSAPKPPTRLVLTDEGRKFEARVDKEFGDIEKMLVGVCGGKELAKPSAEALAAAREVVQGALMARFGVEE